MMIEGDISVHLNLAETGRDQAERVEEARMRSQTETKAIRVAAIDEAIDRETVEMFRAREILVLKERGAQTKDESTLAAEEKLRLRRHQGELSRLIKQSLLQGQSSSAATTAVRTMLPRTSLAVPPRSWRRRCPRSSIDLRRPPRAWAKRTSTLS